MVGAGSHTTTPHHGGATEMVNVVIVSMEHVLDQQCFLCVLTLISIPYLILKS